MGIISGGVQLTGGTPMLDTGTVNPLKVYGVPVDGVDGELRRLERPGYLLHGRLPVCVRTP